MWAAVKVIGLQVYCKHVCRNKILFSQHVVFYDWSSHSGNDFTANVIPLFFPLKCYFAQITHFGSFLFLAANEGEEIDCNQDTNNPMCPKEDSAMTSIAAPARETTTPSLVSVKAVGGPSQPLDIALGVVFALIGIVVVLVLAYYGTKRWRRQQRIRRFLQYR